MAQGEYIVSRTTLPVSAAPSIARVDGSGWVSILGVITSGLSAEDAIDVGHRLVEAGLGARRREQKVVMATPGSVCLGVAPCDEPCGPDGRCERR